MGESSWAFSFPPKRHKTYTPTGMVATEKDALEGMWYYTYDENDNIISIRDPEWYMVRYTYDKDNRPITAKDRRGNVTSFVYDENGNITEVHNPDGGIEYYTYDTNDQVLTYTDGEGYTTYYEYDENGNLVKITDPRGNSRTGTYDPLDQLVQVGIDISHDDVLGEVLSSAGVGVAGTFFADNIYMAEDALMKTYNKIVRIAHDFVSENIHYYFGRVFCGGIINGNSKYDIYKEMTLLSSEAEKRELADKYVEVYRDGVYKNAYAERYAGADVTDPKKSYNDYALNQYLDATVEKYRQDLYRIEEINRELIEKLKERLVDIKSPQEEVEETRNAYRRTQR